MILDNSSINDCIKAIDESGAQIVFVINLSNKVLGTISDGDIRRAMLGGLNFNQPAKNIMNSDFHKISKEDDSRQALSIMKKEKLSHIPVINKKGELNDIILIEDFLSSNDTNYTNTIVLMAGGQGKRLFPLTKNIPKPMLKINGKPMLETLIEKCAEDGFTNILISVNYKKKVIEDYFSDGKKWGVKIDFQTENEPLGTAGSLSLMRDKKKLNYPIIVMNADVVTPLSLKKLLNFHNSNTSKATICTMTRLTEIPFGVVNAVNGVVKSFQEKPTLVHNILTGIYVLDQEILENLEYNIFCDMPDLLKKALKSYKLATFPLYEYWLDAGLPENFEAANKAN